MTTTSPQPTAFNPFDPVYRGWDRYTVLAELREAEPPVAVDVLGRAWAFRYDDVHAMLINSEELEAQETSAALNLGFQENCPFHQFQQHAMISQNPPRHTRLRKAQQYFGKHQLKALTPAIRAACDELIDGFPADGEIEFAYEFAFKLPVGVIMRMLNLPAADEDRIREWSPKSLPSSIEPEGIASCDAANAAMRAYVEEIMDQRRAEPLEDDIISEMLAVEREGGLSHDEIWAQVVSLIVAGHETTTSALSLLVHALLENPDQLELLRADPGLVNNAAYEILRYEPPLDQAQRRVHTEWEMYGVTMGQGSLVVPSLSAANRDPRKYPDPDRFDVTRANALTHLAFGAGIHRCLGASLAVLELQVALGALLERLESFELAGEPRLAATGVFRCYDDLPLRVRRRD